MKKLMACSLLVFIGYGVAAQIVVALLFGDKLNTNKLEFGLVVSPVLTNITHIESKSKAGINAGIYLNVRPDKNLFLHVEGIAKGSFGAKEIRPYSTGNDTLDNLFAGGAIKRSIQVFSLPVLARYRITQLFFADAGIQANLRLRAKDLFEAKVNDNDLDYTIKVTNRFSKLDFGVSAGLFYKFRKDKKSMGIGVRYFYGLTDTYKPMDGKQANTAWMVNVTIPVGTGKAEAGK